MGRASRRAYRGQGSAPPSGGLATRPVYDFLHWHDLLYAAWQALGLKGAEFWHEWDLVNLREICAVHYNANLPQR